jgi:hypothetical protein
MYKPHTLVNPTEKAYCGVIFMPYKFPTVPPELFDNVGVILAAITSDVDVKVCEFWMDRIGFGRVFEKVSRIRDEPETIVRAVTVFVIGPVDQRGTVALSGAYNTCPCAISRPLAG